MEPMGDFLHPNLFIIVSLQDVLTGITIKAFDSTGKFVK